MLEELARVESRFFESIVVRRPQPHLGAGGNTKPKRSRIRLRTWPTARAPIGSEIGFGAQNMSKCTVGSTYSLYAPALGTERRAIDESAINRPDLCS
jgi:hypothetical protein